MAGKMSLRDAWAGFFGGADDAGIKFESEPTNTVTVGALSTGTTMYVPSAITTSAATLVPQQDDDDRTAELEARATAQSDALAAAQARIAALENEARTAKFTALAAAWIGDKDTHLAMLTALEGNDTLFLAYQQQQASAAEVARQSGLFKAAGSDRSGGGSAWDQIESKAKVLMAEDKSLTKQAAIMQVAESDKELYAQYRAEQ